MVELVTEENLNGALIRWLRDPDIEPKQNNQRETSIKGLQERVTRLEKILNTLMKGGIEIQPMTVPDYPEKDIEKCTAEINEYLKDHDSIDPTEYAKKKGREYNLVLLCIDRMISNGILEL